MKKARTKKYPIFTYLCYLLVVSILFTGVTFSRYSITQSGGASSGVAAFNCSYSIDNFSSFNFNNANYWLSSGMAVGVSRTVRYTLKNYDENGVVSGVDVDGHLRLSLPAELADNFAIQIETSRVPDSFVGTYMQYTPQFVLKELLYEQTGGQETDDPNDDTFGGYKSYGNGDGSDDGIETSSFTDYGALGSVPSEHWTVTGGLNDNGGTVTVSNSGGSGIQMSISKETRNISYSVGFKRSSSQHDISSSLYLDLTKKEAYYLIDIFLPTMCLEGGKEDEGQYVVYFTLTNSIQQTISWNNATNVYKVNNDGTMSETPLTNLDCLITAPPASNEKYIIGSGGEITIDGYHFEQNTTQRENDQTVNNTTVRVKCEYDYKGGYKISLYHVERIEEGDGLYVHPLNINDTYSGTFTYSDIEGGKKIFKDLTATCSKGVTVEIASLTADPLYIDSATRATIEQAMSRSYNFGMTALFVQASQTGSAGGES